MKNDLSQLNKLFRPLQTLVANMISRAIIKVIDDGRLLQEVQIVLQSGETRDRCEVFRQYGMTSHPLPGAEAVVAFVGGRRDHPLVTNIDDRRYRKKDLEAGEVALYNHEGTYILLKNGAEIEIFAATKVRINSPLVEMSGNLVVEGTSAITAPNGEIADQRGTMQEMRTTYNSHTHDGDSGGKTGSPDQPME